MNTRLLSMAESQVQRIPELSLHIMAAGGKRLRPMLTLASARLCGLSEGERHIGLAAAVECLHTATLLHDDVVDDSTTRRGFATANALWDNKTSVLVGDYLLGQAFKLMVADGSLEVLRILANASAVIAEGEVFQLTTVRNLTTSMEAYAQVIEAKTATLFAAACEVGAVVSGREDAQKSLHNYGLALGMAFQITDDLLDFAADPARLGKNIGDDFFEGKMTLPVILAYAQGSAEERAFWERVYDGTPPTDTDLQQACRMIVSGPALAAVRQQVTRHCERARQALAGFKSSPFRDALLEVVDFCEQRQY